MEQLWRLHSPFLVDANALHPHGQAFDLLPAEKEPLLNAQQAWREDNGAAETFTFNVQRTALSQLTDRVRYPHAIAAGVGAEPLQGLSVGRGCHAQAVYCKVCI